MEEKITQLIRSLNIIFWGNFLSSILTGILIILLMPHNVIGAQFSINLQSVAILILLGCVPLALWLYHKKLISETLPDDMEQGIALIRKWFIIRLALVEFALLFNVIIYSLTKNSSFLYCCGIILMIFLFLCRPNRNEIVHILSKNDL